MSLDDRYRPEEESSMRAFVVVCLIASSLIAAVPASALPLFPELRPRAGVGFSPDQFVVGVQALLRARLFGLVRLAPSADVGFGDNETTTLLNLDLLSTVLPVGHNVGLYGGAGLSVDFASGSGHSSTDVGATLVGGTEFGSRFYAEGRFGLDKMPDVRLLVGIRMVRK
jgi:hypothetical protein